MEELEGAKMFFVSAMVFKQVIYFNLGLIDFIYVVFLYFLLVHNFFSRKK